MDSDSTAKDIKDALNDLPTLYPNLIMDVNQTLESNGKDLVLIIKFSPELGIRSSFELFKNKLVAKKIKKYF